MAKRDYEVGYGKPPRHTQFQPGSSGFAGRKKKRSKSFADLFDQLLGEKVPVNQQGKPMRIDKRELILRQLINAAAGGDPRMLKLCVELYLRIQPGQDAAPRGDADEKLLAELIAAFPIPCNEA